MERITATYLIETPLELARVAEVLAGEQSSGTFVAVPGETAELKARYAARVEQIEMLETVTTSSLPGVRGGSGKFQRARIRISWPLENVGYNLPALVSTLQGNLYELAQLSGLRLLDFDLPASFAAKFPGPRFGVAGTRRLAGVNERPLIGTIIKPSVGLSPAETAEMVQTLCEAGIDFIKDDELMANPPHSPFNERVAAVMKVIHAHADRTGKQVMYAFNITEEFDTMQRNYDTLLSARATCAMVSINPVGLTAVHKLAQRGELPIHAHRNGWGQLTRHPLLGMEFTAYQKLWRLAGVDQLHVNGIANKFWEPDDSVVKSLEACSSPFLSGQPLLPVVSSGQWGGQAFETYRRFPSQDLLYLAGGGIAAHPGGPAAGVRAIQSAWRYAVDGLKLEEAAERSPDFKASIEKFGRS